MQSKTTTQILRSKKNGRVTLETELQKLQKVKEKIIRHDEVKKQKLEDISMAHKQLKAFAEDNKDLIAEAEKEKELIKINMEISSSYKDYISKLHAYRTKLPSLLIADLADITKDLYNAFNRNDPENDKLSQIRLPLESGSRIEIAFNSNPIAYYDALHILSEGHIRCLGLSILLAKNLKGKYPFLIFDDPVNAIDDEHREGIRRTIFEDDFFDDTQIILTTHGEEFFKDVHNLIGSEASKEAKSYVLLPHLGDNKIRIDSSPQSRNYVSIARTKFDKQEIREALANSRRALEFLSKETWNIISKNGDGNLSVKLRTPKAVPELRNIVEQLLSKAKRDSFIFANKEDIINALVSLTGISGQTKEWNYLNKGTHEEMDRSEFERPVVGQIIEALEKLEKSVIQ